MAIGIDDLDDMDDVVTTQSEEEEEVIQETPENEEVTNESETETSEEEDAISAFLKTKGIEDPSKIKFENEEGDIEEVNWDNLSKEEQLNILNTSNTDPDRALDDSEINLINEIRLSGLSIEEFKNNLIQKAIQDIQPQQELPKYEIDNIPDDELYLLDLQQKLGDNVTDEELLKALELEKQNPTFYQKKINGLRQEYKALEDQQRNAKAEEEQKLYQEQFQQFQNNVLEEIQGLNKIGNMDIELELDDMNDVANFILSRDNAGINFMAKALNDPKNLVKAAWFLTKGEQALNDISDYFTQQIKYQFLI